MAREVGPACRVGGKAAGRSVSQVWVTAGAGTKGWEPSATRVKEAGWAGAQGTGLEDCDQAVWLERRLGFWSQLHSSVFRLVLSSSATLVSLLVNGD